MPNLSPRPRQTDRPTDRQTDAPAETAGAAAKVRTPTPAELARLYAGLSVEEAARRVWVGVSYLKRLEKRGAFPLVLADRLAREYGCSCDVFLLSYRLPVQNVVKPNRSSKSKSRSEGAKRERKEDSINRIKTTRTGTGSGTETGKSLSRTPSPFVKGNVG